MNIHENVSRWRRQHGQLSHYFFAESTQITNGDQYVECANSMYTDEHRFHDVLPSAYQLRNRPCRRQQPMAGGHRACSILLDVDSLIRITLPPCES